MARIADFPDWLGPMLVKELRQGLKTRGFVLSFLGLQGALVFLTVLSVLLHARDPVHFDRGFLGGIFWMLVGGLLLFVIPLRALNDLAAERKANTLELIYLSGLSAWRISFGKWISLLFQALLLILAVLPFGIVRYYFGGVNLFEEFQLLLFLIVCCAAASAAALAISGLPLWARVLAIAITVLVFMLFFSEPMRYLTSLLSGHGRSGLPSMLPPFGDFNWWLVAFDGVLACLLALEIAAATVAPLAENHAGRERFIALLFWLPVPFLLLFGGSRDAQVGQLALFVLISGSLVWYHLSERPVLLQSHCRSFQGRRSIWGFPFQPGWPSAVVFLLGAMLLFILVQLGSRGASRSLIAFTAAVLMISAAFLSATFFWIAFRPRARSPLLVQIIFITVCCVLMVLMAAGKPHSVRLGDLYFFALLPAMGFCAMLDSQGYGPGPAWLALGGLVFIGYALALLAASREYWAKYLRTCYGLAPTAQPALSDDPFKNYDP